MSALAAANPPKQWSIGEKPINLPRCNDFCPKAICFWEVASSFSPFPGGIFPAGIYRKKPPYGGFFLAAIDKGPTQILNRQQLFLYF